MKTDLATVLGEFRNGRGPSVLLVCGDDVHVQEACQAIIDVLVPVDQRAFNLERHDGRNVSWDEIESSIMTPPFLTGKKILRIENAPYFSSREQKGELAAKVLQLWQDGQRDDAASLLADWLVFEGWAQVQWEGLDSASVEQLAETMAGEDPALREAAEAVLLYCRGKGLELKTRSQIEGNRLDKLLERGFPPWCFVLLTALQVDRRARLYKRLEVLGGVLNLCVERDRSGKISREALIDFLNKRLRAAGKTIEPRAREMLLARAAQELWSFEQELEKLILYLGNRPAVAPGDVETIVADRGEGWVLDLTRAIAGRDVKASLGQLTRLLAQGEHPLKLLAVLASEMRKLLIARQYIDRELRGVWRRGLSYEQFQRILAANNRPFVMRNPYADYMCFQRAEQLPIDELITHMRRIFETDLRLKSTGSSPRRVLERLILDMCLPSRPWPPMRNDVAR